MAQQTATNEPKTVHFDKIAESLDDHNAVEDYSVQGGMVYVQFGEEKFADSALIDELHQWGIEILNVDFEHNQIGFQRRD